MVFAPRWRGDREFDESLPFQVVRYNRSLMLPVPRVSRMAADLLREHSCDSVLFGASAPLALMSGKLRRAGAQQIVGITHGHEAAWSITPGGRAAMARIGEQTDALTYLGEYTRQRIASAIGPAAAARMRRLVPGVEVERFSPANRVAGDRLRRQYGLEGRWVIACVSRLMARKGQDTLINALAIVRQRHPKAALLIVGSGPAKARLERLAVRAGQADHVVFTGAVPNTDLPSHYAAADVFAMPCRTRNKGRDVEGLGIVYLEASSSGIPVIAGNSGGAPDAVVQGETGFVVDGRGPAATAEALTTLIEDPERADQIGRNGRQWIEQSWQWTTSSARLADLLAGRDPDLRTDFAIH